MLTRKQQLFVAEYLKDFNGTQAAARAGYSIKTAHVQAFALLRHPKIRQALVNQGDRAIAKAGASSDRVIAELARVAFSDMADYVECQPDGTVRLDFSKIKQDGTSRAIAGLDQEVEIRGGREEQVPVRKTRIRLWDKVGALAQLVKVLQVGQLPLPARTAVEPEAIRQLTPVEVRARWADGIEEAAARFGTDSVQELVVRMRQAEEQG